MKIAIQSVSKKGYELSMKLKELLSGDPTIIRCDTYHKNVGENIKHIFNEYDAIIAIMASGILIRSIDGLLKSKTTDPAVLNIDDNGNFVISMLSGHLGGANRLTEKISKLINAQPVITTSSDISNKLGIDVLARDLYMAIDDTHEILHFNKAIIEGKKIIFKLSTNSNYRYLFEYLINNTLEMNVFFYFTDKVKNGEIEVKCDNHKLTLKPRKLVLGIGCRRGKEFHEILDGINEVLKTLDINITRINQLASAEIKKDENGILLLSELLNIPVNFVEMEKLKVFKSDDISESEFVRSKFGIPGVCEPSALITAGSDSKLIYKKTAFNGVTLAMVVSKN